MAEDSSNPFASIIGALANKEGARGGVHEGVIKDSAQGVSPILTPAETARYEKIFGVMKRIVNPGPEAGQLDKTSAGKVGGVAAMQAAAKGKAAEGGGIDLGPLALAGVAAGVIGAALTQMEEDFINKIKSWGEGIVEFADSTGDEFGKLGAIAAKIAKFLPLKFLKTLPFIGSLVNFYDAWVHFENEEYFEGGWELVSGITNFLPGGQFISPLMDGYKIYAEILANKEAKKTGKKPALKDILGKQLKAIGTYVVNLIVDGKVPILSTFYKFGEGIGLMLSGSPDGLSRGLEAWTHILPSLLGGKESPVYKYVSEGLGILWEMTKETSSSAFETAGQMAGDAWSWMSELFSSIGETLSSFFDGIKSWIGDVVSKGKKAIYNSLPGWAQDAWTSLSGYDPNKEENERIERDHAAARQKYQDRKAFAEWHELNDPEGIEKWSAPPKSIPRNSPEMMEFIKGQKAYYNSSYDAYKAEMAKRGDDWVAEQMSINDGIVHQNGRSTRIDSMDSGIFAKKGGPIDKLLDQNSEVMKTIQGINKQQLSVLIEIRDGILELQKPADELSFSSPSLTQDFFS